MSDQSPAMTSNRPYLLRAIHEWIIENDMTPHLLVDARQEGVRVPPQAIKDGRVVLNIATRAVNQLELGNQEIRFLARFGGVSQAIRVPLAAVLAIYALESGQGMALPAETPDDATVAAEASGEVRRGEEPGSASVRPLLSAVPAHPSSTQDDDAGESGEPRTADANRPDGDRPPRPPHLRVIK
ncbi:MAG: ClpXP protease specificity-enhancing factor [Lysobacteraceae bacterium]